MTKLKSASRFEARYSTPLKNIVRDIEKVQKTKQPCPQCGRSSLKRRGNAKWECTKCSAVIAGGAYSPTTPTGKVAERIVKKGEKLAFEDIEKVIGVPEAPEEPQKYEQREEPKKEKKEKTAEQLEEEDEEEEEEQEIEKEEAESAEEEAPEAGEEEE
ncbi:MAG: hypothetical protein V1911_01585 [Candidatus Micrarchaeota archaeon]